METKQTVNCWWCDRQFEAPEEVIEKQLQKFGGNFDTKDCKSEYVYAEFEHMMQNNYT